MSNFLSKGKREQVRDEKRLVKRHMKAMYRIMGEVKELAEDIHNDGEDWNEDNIEEIVAQYTDLKLADMEKFLLLGNLQRLRDEGESKDKSN